MLFAHSVCVMDYNAGLCDTITDDMFVENVSSFARTGSTSG